MASEKTETFHHYLARNSNKLFQYCLDKIEQCGMIDIKDVTIFEVAKTECMNSMYGDPEQPLYKYTDSVKITKITNYPDQHIRSPLTVESLRLFTIGRLAQYSDSEKPAHTWRQIVFSTELLFRCNYCKTYHVRNMSFFIDNPGREGERERERSDKGYKDECPLCLYSYKLIQHQMNEIGLDVDGTEKDWNERNAGKIGTLASFTLLYNDCDCNKKCTMKINQFKFLQEKLSRPENKLSTNGTLICPNKTGSTLTRQQIGNSGEEYVKNAVRDFCLEHDLPGIILYAFECGPGDLIFGIAEEPNQTKYDIMYIQIQIKTKSGKDTWHSQNRESYPDNILGILLHLDQKSEDAKVSLVVMDWWHRLTSEITVVPGQPYKLYQTSMLDYAIADTTKIASAIIMFYYKALSNDTTMTYEEAFRPWPSHRLANKEFECQQNTEKTNQKWCVYQCLEPPYSKADNTITMKVKINNDYTKALKKKLFYEIERDNMECIAIIRMNDQSKSWDGVKSLTYLSNFERNTIYEGPLAEKICDQVHAFHWYDRSTDNNYLIPFGKLYHYVYPNGNEMGNEINYKLVMKKLVEDDDNWPNYFKEYLYKYNTEIPIRILSRLMNMKAVDILAVSIEDLPEGNIGFVDKKEILLKILDQYNN